MSAEAEGTKKLSEIKGERERKGRSERGREMQGERGRELHQQFVEKQRERILRTEHITKYRLPWGR